MLNGIYQMWQNAVLLLLYNKFRCSDLTPLLMRSVAKMVVTRACVVTTGKEGSVSSGHPYNLKKGFFSV